MKFATGLNDAARNLTTIRNQKLLNYRPAIVSANWLRDEQRFAERRSIIVGVGHVVLVRRRGFKFVPK